MSVTQQKQDLREIIHRKIAYYLEEHPDAAQAMAMGAIQRLSGRMTLRELENWHIALFVRIPEEDG